MKNSPIIRIEDTSGDKLNINASQVVMFYERGGKTYVYCANTDEYTVKCTERSFRGYMNKALGVTKEEKASEE